MRIDKKQSKISRKPILITLLVILLLATGVTVASVYQWGPFQKTPAQNVTTLEKQNKSDSTNPLSKEEAASTSKDVDKSKNTAEIPLSTTANLAITKLIQENRGITYAAIITNGGSSGTCSAIFSHELAKPVVSTTSAHDGKCGPVNIPETEFSALGTWTLTLRYYTNNSQVVATKTMDVR